MLASAIRIREHGVRLLQAAELGLAAARMVRVALLCQPPVGVSDLGPGSAAGNAQDLVVVDLVRHRASILTYEPASESPSCRFKEALRACSISNRHPLSSASPSAASATLPPISPSAQAACPRTSGDPSLRKARTSAGTASSSPRFPAATQQLRRSPARPGRVRGVSPKCSSNFSSVRMPRTSVIFRYGPAPEPAENSGQLLGMALRLLYGQTSWQTSQPKAQSPTARRSSRGISPVFSIVRYEIQSLASTTPGAFIAPVGQADMQRVHLPQVPVPCASGSIIWSTIRSAIKK